MSNFNNKIYIMKKLLLLTPSLIALSSLCAMAQKATVGATSKPIASATIPPSKNEQTPSVTIGTIESPITSREKVLAYPRLLVQDLNCEVTGFSCTIACNGKTYGPFKVKGAVFNDDIKDKVKELEAPPKVKISIDDIHVKCNGGDEVTAKPINVEYDH
jgi:hypothetical protein